MSTLQPHRRRVGHFALCIALLLAALVMTGSIARANGRYPQAGQVLLDPSDAAHLAVRATYGLVQTSDGGGTWTWICEKALGYTGLEDPSAALFGDGAILVGSSGGLRVTRDRGCSFTPAEPPLDWPIADVTVVASQNSQAVVIAVSPPSAAREARVGRTCDGGRTWTALTPTWSPDLLPYTIDVPSARPDRMYVSGQSLFTRQGTVARSDDGGQTWQLFTLPSAVGTYPYIGGVDPMNPDRVYIRVTGQPDALLVSSDAAQTWQTAFTAAGRLLGFAISPDGTKVALGGPADGLLIASSADLQFHPAKQFTVNCLSWKASGLFACGDQTKDGFAAGVSMDEGATFRAIYRQPELVQLSCQIPTCGDGWGPVAVAVGADAGDYKPPPEPGLVGIPEGADQRKGCSCSSVRTPPGWPAALALMLVLPIRRWRRNRARGVRCSACTLRRLHQGRHLDFARVQARASSTRYAFGRCRTSSSSTTTSKGSQRVITRKPVSLDSPNKPPYWPGCPFD